MEKQELCQAGALLAQRMEIGVESLRTGAAEVRTACNEVVGALQGIRDTTTALHVSVEDVKRRADLNDKQTLDLGKQVPARQCQQSFVLSGGQLEHTR
jgi:hypothetical protein